MPRYRDFFSPYFTSNAFQNSDERKIEKAIEDRFKSICYLISKIWKHNPDTTKKEIELKKAIEIIINEDQELLDRLKKFD
jgi:hypothetical protein